MEAQDRHTKELLSIQGVVGTAVGVGPNGRPTILALTEHGGVGGFPSSLDGFAVQARVTSKIVALGAPAAPPPLDANFTSSCNRLACDFEASSTTGTGKKTYS